MIEQYEQTHIIEKRSSLFLKIFTFWFCFFCFFPYPAIPIGKTTGMQVSQILALIYFPFLIFRFSKKYYWATILILGPLLISAVINEITMSTISSMIMLKTIASRILIFMVFFVGGNLIKKGNIQNLLYGASWAIFIHSLIGFFQIICFKLNVFPLKMAILYQNPTFPISQKTISTYVLYIKRPMGLFPEPSAMASSIGPWIVLLVGIILYPDFFTGLTRKYRIFFIIVSIASLIVIIFSKSGYIFGLFLCLFLLLIPKLYLSLKNIWSIKKILFILISISTIIGTAIVGFIIFKERSGINNLSWQMRFSSLNIGNSILFKDIKEFLFGLGTGQSHLHLVMNLPYYDKNGIHAIWSILINYFAETGVIGIIASIILLLIILHAILHSPGIARWIGLVSLFAWLFGITFTTSYWCLFSIWLFLALLLSWDVFFYRKVNKFKKKESNNYDHIEKAALNES